MAIFSGHFVDFFHGFQSGQFYAGFFGGLEGEENVFVHEAQREVGSEIALEDEWSFVVDDAGADHGGFDQGQKLFGIDTKLGGESEGFGKAFEDEGDLKIHGQLGGLTFAGFAHSEDFLAHGGEEGTETVDDSAVAADHEDQGAVGGADFRSGHGSVDVGHTFGAHTFGEFYSGGGRDGAGIGDDHALGEGLVDAISAEEDLLDGGGVRDAEPYDFGSLGGCGGSGGHAGAFDEFAGSAIPNRDFVTGLDQVCGHGLTHDSETEEGYAHYEFS